MALYTAPKNGTTMGERCKAITANKLRCKNTATDATGLCTAHMPKTDVVMVDIADLEARVCAIEAALAKLVLFKSSSPKKKVLRMFYHAHKTNETILNDIKDKLQKGGLPINKIPWTYIKQYTDNIFNNMSREDQEIWYAKVT